MSKVPSFFSLSNPLSRQIVHGGFWTFLVFAVVTYFGGFDVWGHDDEWFLVYLYLLSAIGLLVPYMLFRWTGKKVTLKQITRIEFLSFLAMLLSWLGGFGLYRVRLGYDTLVHFSASAMLAVIFFMVLLVLYPQLSEQPLKLILLIGFLTLLGGLINEVFEWSGDQFLGTSMYGELGEANDTAKDFAANTFGFLTGAAIGFYKRKDWI